MGKKKFQNLRVMMLGLGAGEVEVAFGRSLSHPESIGPRKALIDRLFDGETTSIGVHFGLSDREFVVARLHVGSTVSRTLALEWFDLDGVLHGVDSVTAEQLRNLAEQIRQHGGLP